MSDILIETRSGKSAAVPRDAVKYVDVAERDVPHGLIWITPARLGGQMIEVAYAWGRPSRSEPDVGAQWKRVEDRTTGRMTYYRLSIETEAQS